MDHDLIGHGAGFGMFRSCCRGPVPVWRRGLRWSSRLRRSGRSLQTPPVLLLVPADPLRSRRPDAHFAAEARAAAELGVTVAVVDHDAVTEAGGAARAVARVPQGAGGAWYRGWMVTSDQYRALAQALADRDVGLWTEPAQYQRAHELPGWYPTLAPVTPTAAWTTSDREEEFHRCRAPLGAGPAVLRDHVKSMKHHWHEAAYIPDLADHRGAWAVAARFRELRGDDFTGGFVIRRFEPFTSAEVRTWWVGGACRLITAHPDTPDAAPPPDLDLASVTPLIPMLGLPFVTADLARRADGIWRLVELGDGQVSDRPASTEPAELIAALFPAP